MVLTHGLKKGSMPFSTVDLQAKEGGKDFDRSQGSFCRTWRPFSDRRDIYRSLRSFVQAAGKV
jgi:hypothetical protein